MDPSYKLIQENDFTDLGNGEWVDEITGEYYIQYDYDYYRTMFEWEE